MISAHLRLDTSVAIGAVDRRLFGAFVEHMGRGIYTGIYEPDHPTADPEGFRMDVLDLVRELGVSTIRYPGGNFVSGFRWEDSVGPRESRPPRLDLAWHSTETNEVGLHEFASWLSKIDAELMLAVNLGTRGLAEAVDLLEYTNVVAPSAIARTRVANGHADPFGVKFWCLGNEMDAPWQLGHCSAEDYGKLASRVAKAMRQVDPDVELALCGSSGTKMPTFGQWEREALTQAYDDVDFITCHAYYAESNSDLASFLASAVDMDHMIDSVVRIADEVRDQRPGRTEMMISFDEWNVWDVNRYKNQDRLVDTDNWPLAPRILEDVYTAADGVVVGSLLISLLRHADRVRSGSLAQLVNVIAPIMTEPGGMAWRQTIYYPFALTSANARGHSLQIDLTSPHYNTELYGRVPEIDAASTFDERSGRLAVFVVNRNREQSCRLTLEVKSEASFRQMDAWSFGNAREPGATNTAQNPLNVTPKRNSDVHRDGSRLSITLPPASWTVLRCW